MNELQFDVIDYDLSSIVILLIILIMFSAVKWLLEINRDKAIEELQIIYAEQQHRAQYAEHQLKLERESK